MPNESRFLQMAEKTQTKHFLRIFNTAIDGGLPISRSLLKIRGLGDNFIKVMCDVLAIDPKTPAGTLSEANTKKIEEFVANPPKTIPVWMLNRQKDFETGKNEHLVLAGLKLRKDFDIKRLRRIKTYKGVRHSAGLPVRGQSTKAHFRKKGRAVGVKKPKKRGK